MNTNSRETVVTIGEVSKRTGINIETIRYYERIGWLPKPSRSASGYRQYEEMHIKRLSFIKRSRQLGFNQEEIRSLFQLIDGGELTCAEVKTITLRHLSEITAKLADLKKVEQVLIEMAAKCDGSDLPDCPIIETLYAQD